MDGFHMITLERLDGFDVAVNDTELAALDVDPDSGGTIVVLKSGYTMTVTADVAGIMDIIKQLWSQPQ